MTKRLGLSPIPKGSLIQDFSNQNLSSLADLDFSPTLVTLNLSNNPLKTLESLRTIPTLTKLILDNTEIDTFRGIRPQPSLSTISVDCCPLSNYEFLSVMCTIVFGDNILQINGQNVNENDKYTGRETRSHLKPYLLQGWIIVSLNPLVLKHVLNGDILPLSDTYKITPIEPEILEQSKEIQVGTVKFKNSSPPVSEIQQQETESSSNAKIETESADPDNESRIKLPEAVPRLWSSKHNLNNSGESSSDTMMVDTLVFSSDDEDAMKETDNQLKHFDFSQILPPLIPQSPPKEQESEYKAPPIKSMTDEVKVEKTSDNLSLSIIDPHQHGYEAPPLSHPSLETPPSQANKKEENESPLKEEENAKNDQPNEINEEKKTKKKSSDAKSRKSKKIIKKKKKKKTSQAKPPQRPPPPLPLPGSLGNAVFAVDSDDSSNPQKSSSYSRLEEEEEEEKQAESKKDNSILGFGTLTIESAPESPKSKKSKKQDEIIPHKKWKAKTVTKTQTEIFETDDDDDEDDPPVFKKVSFFKLIGVNPDSDDEYMSQDDDESVSSGSINPEDYNVTPDVINDLRIEARNQFYKMRTTQTSTLEEMEKFVSKYVKLRLNGY